MTEARKASVFRGVLRCGAEGGIPPGECWLVVPGAFMFGFTKNFRGLAEPSCCAVLPSCGAVRGHLVDNRCASVERTTFRLRTSTDCGCGEVRCIEEVSHSLYE
jgi:hypothetical protein